MKGRSFRFNSFRFVAFLFAIRCTMESRAAPMRASQDPIEARKCNVADQKLAESFERAAIAHLKSEGYRVTNPRRLVVRELAAVNRPLPPSEIHEKIAGSGSSIDLVSVYRILHALESVGLIHHIAAMDGYLACRSDAGSEHHAAHFICSRCGCVDEQVLDETACRSIEGQGREAGFATGSFRVEVLGTCRHCRGTEG